MGVAYSMLNVGKHIGNNIHSERGALTYKTTKKHSRIITHVREAILVSIFQYPPLLEHQHLSQ